MLGIVSMMFTGLVATASASPNPGGGETAAWNTDSFPPIFGAVESDVICGDACSLDDAFADGAQEVYFPAVGYADDFGLGPAQTSITVQNIDIDDAYIFIYVGNHDGTWTEYDYAYLSAGASKTFRAEDLGIAEGDVVPVIVSGYNQVLSSGAYVVDVTAVNAYLDSVGGAENATCVGPGSIEDYGLYQEDAQYILENYDAPQLDADQDSVACEALAGGPDSTTLYPVFMAGVAKQAVTGDNLPYTTAADTSVSGYNAVSGREIGFFDQLYFPIVQTNCGPGGCWDSILRIANFGIDRNAAVTVSFFPADDGSGSLQTGFQLQALVNSGDVWSIDLADWVPSGWVGSAHVYTDDAVVAIADRFKVGTSMWITNTASNAAAESFWQFPGGPSAAPYVLWAPDVRTDYNGWNTGINVANTVDYDNDVTIQYFGSNGNAPAAQQRRLAAQGMTYFYNPSQPSEDDCQQPATDVPGCEYIGGAVILSTDPVAVAVDGVKYFGNDANVGQAFSYAATGNAFTDLAAPLVQKGNPSTGMGATSGINFMNANAEATLVDTTWINPSGFAASNFATSIVWVPGYSTGFVYTMLASNLPNGYFGSAIVNSELPISATTANVDYQVSGDGTVVWNLYNPCGFFRQSGFPGDDPDCVYQAPVTEPGADATITKEVICPDCTVADVNVEGALVSYEGTDNAGFEHNGSGYTGTTGAVVFAVPAGDYTFTLESLPSVYDQSTVGETDPVSVATGDNTTVTDIVSEATVTKIVDTNVPGITVCIFLAGDVIPSDITVDTTGSVACATADEAGNATFTGLAAGVDYTAVAQGLGYDQMTDDFNIAIPGDSETNTLTSPLPGALSKVIELGDFGLGVGDGTFSLNADVAFCRADDVDTNGDQIIDATEALACDDWTTDDAVIVHGGYDDFIGGSDFLFELNAIVAPGDYVICSSAFVTGDFDADPLTPDETVGYDFTCEATSDLQMVDGVPTTGTITVYSGLETYVLNDFSALTPGTIDVYVNDDDTDAPIDGANVCLYDAAPAARLRADRCDWLRVLPGHGSRHVHRQRDLTGSVGLRRLW